MRHIDFVITNPRHHLAMFLPVVSGLAARGDAVRVRSLCELRGYVTPAERIRAAGAQCDVLMPVRLGKDSPRVQYARRTMSGAVRRWTQTLLWRALIRWHGSAGRPDLVVVPNDVAFPYDRITAALRGAGIRFLLMQEGIRFELPAAGARRYGQGGAAAVAAWGPSSVHYFTAAGVASNRVYATGNPRLDELIATDWSEAAARARETLRVSGRVLLVVSNPIDLQGFCTEEAKYEIVGGFLSDSLPALRSRGMHVLIKIHPSESLRSYEALARAVDPSRVTVTRDADLYPLFVLSEAVVTMGSTAGLEALLFDRPLGVLGVPGQGHLYDYADSGAAVSMGRGPDAAAPLAALLSPDEARTRARAAYLRDQVAHVGGATAAVLGVIDMLVPGPLPAAAEISR